MSGRTSGLQIPYVTANDEIRDYPTVSRQLADRLDAVIGTDNAVFIGGQKYQLSGVSQNFPRPSLSLVGGMQGAYAGVMEIPDPYTPPAGYGFKFSVIHSTGNTFLDGNQRLTTGKTRVRIMQFGSNLSTALVSISWQLVKVA